MFIKLLKNKKISSKTNTSRQYTLLNTRLEKRKKDMNESKEKINEKINLKKDLIYTKKDKKNSKSTLSILNK